LRPAAAGNRDSRREGAGTTQLPWQPSYAPESGRSLPAICGSTPGKLWKPRPGRTCSPMCRGCSSLRLFLRRCWRLGQPPPDHDIAPLTALRLIRTGGGPSTPNSGCSITDLPLAPPRRGASCLVSCRDRPASGGWLQQLLRWPGARRRAGLKGRLSSGGD